MAWGAIAAAVAGSAISAFGQSQTNKANKEMSQRQMDHQLYMSNTAYQRGMSDMKKAGLNPILAYKQGGATTSPGASIAQQNPMSSFANVGSQAASTALQLEQAEQTQLQNFKTKYFGNSTLGNQAYTAYALKQFYDRNTKSGRHVERQYLPPDARYKTQNYPTGETGVSAFMDKAKRYANELFRHWMN